MKQRVFLIIAALVSATTLPVQAYFFEGVCDFHQFL